MTIFTVGLFVKQNRLVSFNLKYGRFVTTPWLPFQGFTWWATVWWNYKLAWSFCRCYSIYWHCLFGLLYQDPNLQLWQISVNFGVKVPMLFSFLNITFNRQFFIRVISPCQSEGINNFRPRHITYWEICK